VFARVLGVATDRALVDPHVAAVNPTQLLQGLRKRRNDNLTQLI
jgi:hypothetical protein